MECAYRECGVHVESGKTFHRCFETDGGLREKHFCSLRCLKGFAQLHPDREEPRADGRRMVHIDAGGTHAF